MACVEYVYVRKEMEIWRDQFFLHVLALRRCFWLAPLSFLLSLFFYSTLWDPYIFLVCCCLLVLVLYKKS
ncbi:hypothetical protein BC829DRAFT_408372 [Chytridium lagenaria]|nr:hypothetical protein BC829DRAFT_408372 [Chytridium lagenaria]